MPLARSLSFFAPLVAFWGRLSWKNGAEAPERITSGRYPTAAPGLESLRSGYGNGGQNCV